MELFQEAKSKANSRLAVADHILTQTYPLIRDPKLLLAVLENLFLSLTNAMAAVLHYERTFKRVPAFAEKFENKYLLFAQKCVPRYNIDKEYLKLIKDIKDLIIAHKKSPVEFARKDCFVICSSSYTMKTVGLEQMKKYISKAKRFMLEVNKITSKNEGIFR